jgi:hypothetical protein
MSATEPAGPCTEEPVNVMTRCTPCAFYSLSLTLGDTGVVRADVQGPRVARCALGLIECDRQERALALFWRT